MNYGHMLAGIMLKLKVDSLEIMPFGFAVSFKIDMKNYNKKILKGNSLVVKKIIIALAGPAVNLSLILIFIMLRKEEILKIKAETLIYANILIFVFNMLTIYPLDGGRILKNIVHIFFGKITALKIINIVSITMVSILTLICMYISISFKNYSYMFVLTYVWIITVKSVKICNMKIKMYKILKKYIAINQN